MNPKQFYDKVCEMREAQKDYFRTRSKEALDLSKRLEHEVDAEIDRVERVLKEQQEKQERFEARQQTMNL